MCQYRPRQGKVNGEIIHTVFWTCGRCEATEPLCMLIDIGLDDWRNSMYCFSCHWIWDKFHIENKGGVTA